MLPQLVEAVNTRLGWCLVVAALILTRVVLRRYATPIRDIPGPLFGSFSSLWVVYQLWKGHLEQETIDLHKKHGRCQWIVSKRRV